MTNSKEQDSQVNKKATVQSYTKDPITTHLDNLLLLIEYAAGSKTLKGKNYSEKNENYEPTEADKRRFPRTAVNLLNQIVTLKLQANNNLTNIENLK